jgi:hypothetical protein
MQYVNFDEVVAESIATIGADGNDEIAKQFARQFIWRGLSHLGDSQEIIAVDKIYPNNNLFIRKPKNLKKIIDMALYDSANNLLPHVWHTGKKRIYPQTDGILYTSTDSDGDEISEFVGPIDISEDQYNFILGTNGASVAYAMVRYWQYPLDENGLPLIREDEVEALTMYVRWRWSLRKNENQSEIQANRMVWMQLADQCKAMKKSISNEQAKTIAANRNRMLPNFNRSKF